MSVKRVFGVDSRVQVSPKTSPPYKWICFLQVSFDNESFIGTGFAINMPLINQRMIVMSGHLVFNRSYANTMRVTFPGNAPVQVTRDDLWAPPEYVNSHDPNYDYGLILLPGRCDEGFGWSTLIPDDELHHRLVSICGFPEDKEENTMWISGGRIESSDQHLLYYEIDTMAGMSGSPVYTWHKGYWTVVGIHRCCQSGPSNQANRLLSSMIFTMLGKAGGPKKFALESEAFPNVYMRCNASGFNAPSGSGGGEINCQYGPPREWEIFYFCPVEVAPSLVPQSRESYAVALRNMFWNSTWGSIDLSLLHCTELPRCMLLRFLDSTRPAPTTRRATRPLTIIACWNRCWSCWFSWNRDQLNLTQSNPVSSDNLTLVNSRDVPQQQRCVPVQQLCMEQAGPVHVQRMLTGNPLTVAVVTVNITVCFCFSSEHIGLVIPTSSSCDVEGAVQDAVLPHSAVHRARERHKLTGTDTADTPQHEDCQQQHPGNPGNLAGPPGIQEDLLQQDLYITVW
ncbi:UNVERIFIED_CONTAM: hypothetical protein FKN15_057483 [Acipenser sinensis]